MTMKERAIDKRILEVILADQKAEADAWPDNQQCARYEE